jgi:integrase/recombinase XerD
VNKIDKSHLDSLYQRHLKLLKLQGKAEGTISAYSRAVRRLFEYYDCHPQDLTPDQLQDYFSNLIEKFSWSIVKIDRSGLQFFWKYVLKKQWVWIDIVKPPKVQTIPDILTINEINQILATIRKLRYRVFILTVYSMGLRFQEALSLQVSDIDANRHLLHVRRGKGHKDRMVPLPDLTLNSLRTLWTTHRNSNLLFPNLTGSAEDNQQATTHMDKSTVHCAFKCAVNECGIKKNFYAFPSPQFCHSHARKGIKSFSYSGFTGTF